MENYYARLSCLYAHTKDKECVAVVNSVEKLWLAAHSGWARNCWDMQDDTLRDSEKAYEDEFTALRRSQVPFDYIDEGLLSKDGKVIRENGVTKLQMGVQKYAVAYDNEIAVRESTKDLLQEFANNGGKIVAEIKELPHTVVPHKDVAVTVREGEDGFSVIIAMNFSRDTDYTDVDLRTGLCGYAYEYDARENTITGVFRAENLMVDFARKQDCIFFVCDEQTEYSAPFEPQKTIDLDGEYPFELSEYNALSLKNVRVCINGKDLFEGDAVQADEFVRKHYSLPLHSGEMLQPWFRRKFDPTYMQGRDKITLTYTFTIKTLPPVLYLAYEGDYDVTVNGSTVRKTDIFWKDVCFTVTAIQGKTGENIVKLTKNFAECDDVENVYILSDFGIDEDCAVTDEIKLFKITLITIVWIDCV